MRTSLFIALLLLLTQFADLAIQAQNPYIKHLTINDGLPSNNVYNVFQDSRQFIWFSTDAGAVRFDGTHFKTYTTADGLHSSEVMRIEEDSKGRLWLFHLDGKFSYIYKDRLFTSREEAFLDSLSNSMYFKRMYEDEDQNLYFYCNNYRQTFVLSADNKVDKFQLPSRSVIRSDKGYSAQGNMINKLIKYRGVFWLYLVDGIYMSETLSDSLIPLTTEFQVTRAFYAKNNTFFLDVVYKKQIKRMLIRYDDFKLTDSLYFEKRRSDEIITDVLEDQTGNIWLSSFFSGIYVYQHNKLKQHFNIERSQNILQDHEGNMWIATLGSGVYRLHPSILHHRHMAAKQFAEKGIKTIASGNDNSLWLSDGSYLYQLHKNNLLRSSNPLSDGGINQLGILENGLIVVNEPEQALKIVQAQKQSSKTFHIKTLTKTRRLAKAFSLAPDKKSLAAYYPFYITQLKSVKHGLFTESHHTERFTSIFYSPSGQLFAAGKAIYWLINDSLIPYQPLARLFNKTIRQHLNLNDETQLFNISGDSLWLFRRDTLYSLTAHLERNLPTQIHSMCFDGDSILFMASSSHLYWSPCFMDALSGKKVQLNSLDIRFNNIHQIAFHNQSLHVASEEGLSSIPLQSLKEQQHTLPIPYFREIVLNDSILPREHNQSNVRGKHSIRFSMGSIHYAEGQALFAYRLMGSDTSWIIRKDGNIAYQDLRPGKYNFQFKTAVSGSDWSSEQQHFIHVKPTLMQHPLFFIFLVISSAGIIIWVYLRRKNKLLQEQETAHQMLLLEQKALHSMMNPHFIFNALGSIQNYILKNKATDAGLYLSQFARLIRQNLNAIKTSMIPLDEEVDRLRNYLDLERLRMNGRFSFVIDIADDIEEDVLIPTMILQPIVENAIWHGLSTLENEGVIGIYFTKIDDSSLRIVVEDNGIGIEKAALQTRQKDSHLQMGMNLTLKRLELIGKKLKVETSITSSPLNPGSQNPGTKVTIVVPFVFDYAEFRES